MGWRDYLGFAPVDSESGDPGSIALSTVLERFDIIDVTPDAIVVAERGSTKQLAVSSGVPDTVDLREIGTASPSPWMNWLREEHVPELRDSLGISKYLRMKRSDGTVRGSLRLLKTPIVGAHWYIEPGSSAPKDKANAEWLEDMWQTRMSYPWATTLNEILLSADYGYYCLEKVYTEVNGRVEWSKLAPRHPLDINRWLWDANGGPAGIVMNSVNGKEIEIPIDKLLVFTFDVEGGDVRGMSVLRSAYKHWYYKENLYKIDAIQKERHGIGIPIIKLPVGYNDNDKKIAEDLGRNLRTNERAHVVLPSNWEILFAKLEGQPVDAMTSIDHHNMEIEKNVLAPFMHNSSGSTDQAQSMFMKSTKYVANGIADVINRYGIQELMDLNFQRGYKYPKLCARRIGEWDDLRTMSFAVRNLIGAGVIRPDDDLEESMRNEFDLPLSDPNTARQVTKEYPTVEEQMQMQQDQLDAQAAVAAANATPNSDGGAENQNGSPKPGPAGTPRQAQAGNQRPGAGSSGRQGFDKSGGK